MRVLIWTTHPGDVLGEAITFLTHGPAQHAGFLRLNGLCHEAYMPKVRDRKLKRAEQQFVRILRLVGPADAPVTDSMEAKFERLFDLNIQAGVEYSIADLFRYQLGMDMGGDQQTICSRYVFHCIPMCCGAAFAPLVRCSEDQVAPRDLLISPRLIEETWDQHPETQWDG